MPIYMKTIYMGRIPLPSLAFAGVSVIIGRLFAVMCVFVCFETVLSGKEDVITPTSTRGSLSHSHLLALRSYCNNSVPLIRAESVIVQANQLRSA